MTDTVPESQTNDKLDPRKQIQPTGQPPSVRRSLVLSFIEKYIALLVQIATTAILARLLTPVDYGVFTVAAVIVSITQSLRDFGAMTFIIQERDLTEAQVKTVFGISLIIGCVAAVLVAASSNQIAAFYHNERVRDVLLVLSVNFLLMPYSSLILVLLRREMQFSTILQINLVSVLASSSVGIVLAFFGLHALSLAGFSLAGSASICLMGIIFHYPRSYRIRPSLKEWRRIVSFGTIATTAVVVSTIGEEAPDLIIGRFLGIEALGLFGRASGLVAAFNRLVSSGVAPVAVSALALRLRSGVEIRHEFTAGTVMITGVAWPFFAFLGLMAFPIVRILLGSAWDPVVPLVRILAIAGAISALANLNQLALEAKGAVRNNLRLHLFVQPIVIASVTIAAQFNIWAVAMAFIFGSILFVVASYWQLERLIGVSLVGVMSAAKPSLGVALTSSIGPVLVLVFLSTESWPVWLPILLASIAAVLGWFGGVALLGHPLFAEIQSAIMAIRRSRAGRQSTAV